ncbi:hypothetical protein [uncultured Hymenobacter sp.]|uniref:hypothetical protein n=1 Tax=uncultured Hymenobacter sp. TaxID=170016 RepID=UPI0035C98629
MLLSPQKELFVEEYLKDGDPIGAAIRSGCNADNVQVIAAEWLADWRVVTRLAEYHYAHTLVSGICDSWLRQQLVTIATRCMAPQPVLVRVEGTYEQARSEQGEGLWAFDSTGATAALEMIGRHIGFFARHNQQQYPAPATPDYVQSPADRTPDESALI